MAQRISSLIHPSWQTPPPLSSPFEICITPLSFLFTRVKLLPHTLSVIDLQRELVPGAVTAHAFFTGVVNTPTVKHQHTVILMSGLRGDSLTSLSLTHRLLLSLTCCLTDFEHTQNE